jgi:hypothetical protein
MIVMIETRRTQDFLTSFDLEQQRVSKSLSRTSFLSGSFKGSGLENAGPIFFGVAAGAVAFYLIAKSLTSLNRGGTGYRLKR